MMFTLRAEVNTLEGILRKDLPSCCHRLDERWIHPMEEVLENWADHILRISD